MHLCRRAGLRASGLSAHRLRRNHLLQAPRRQLIRSPTQLHWRATFLPCSRRTIALAARAARVSGATAAAMAARVHRAAVTDAAAAVRAPRRPAREGLAAAAALAWEGRDRAVREAVPATP